MSDAQIWIYEQASGDIEVLASTKKEAARLIQLFLGEAISGNQVKLKPKSSTRDIDSTYGFKHDS